MSFFYLRGGHGRMQLCRVVFFCVLAGQLTFAQHLFDVAKIALSAEQQAVLLAQTAQTRGEPLRSSNATPVKMSVAVPGSGKPGIVLINANSGQSVVLSGFSDRYPEAQLTPLLLAELRQLALGEAAEYLCLEVDDLTAATPQVKRALRVTADSDAVKLPEFKYGTRGNLRTAAAAERTLSAVLLLKPRYTPADPSDPASQQRIQELSEQNAYYAYVYVLPDGSRQLFSPKMAIADSSNARLLKSSTRSTALPFSLTMTGLTTQQQAAVNHAVNLWSQQLYGTIPVKMHIKFLDMGDSMMLVGCYEPNMWPAEDNSSLVPTSIMDQKMEENLRPGEYDIVMTFNTRFSFYFGLDANPPGSNPDFVTVLLHEMTHGLGFFDSINGETINGDLGSYLHGTPFIFDTFLYCNGSRLT
ncbi:MAG: hypothetical protein GX617_11510, partial [Lentisphaerae bacterium]|nr:hypothetical protein [Lentisphaerota bacterium]